MPIFTDEDVKECSECGERKFTILGVCLDCAAHFINPKALERLR